MWETVLAVVGKLGVSLVTTVWISIPEVEALLADST
jgi:hypothetical protein